MPILSYENEISFTCKLNSFSYEWLSTKTRFEKEAKGNSEMAYYVSGLEHVCGVKCTRDFQQRSYMYMFIQLGGTFLM